MKIGIILHPFDEKKPAGLGRYILELTKNLVESDSKNEFIIYLKNKPKNPITFSGNNWHVEVLGFGKFWRELGLLFAPKSDIYIFNTPIMPFFLKPRKSIVIALDYAYKYFEPRDMKESFRNFVLFKMNKFALGRASKIVAISEFTKKETIKLFGIKKEKIEVIYPGFNNICSISETAINLPKKFFLYVGVLKERKNLLNVVKGFNEFKKNKQTDHKLVIVGKKDGWYYEKIIGFIKRENLENEIMFLGFISDSELSFVYKKSTVLVFPSLVEGFGFPVLEAMACGLPVITSREGSLAEVAGEASLLIDPRDYKEISKALQKIAPLTILSDKLKRAGISRSKQFSWQRNSSQLTELIRSLQ
ncbi:glycosyltransferase family 4 protein [Patescibacteria group bacterium]